MISYIRGQLAAIEETKIVVDVGGVGYGIFMPGRVMAKLPQTGTEVTIHTFLNVKEDSMQLFGFLSKDDLAVFKQVIMVSGIGPKGALGILSVMDADALRFAILADDAKSISKAPGIGVKTAGRLILELRDKVDFEEAIEGALDWGEMNAAGRSSAGENGAAANEAIQALVALGYSSAEAVKAVKKVAAAPDQTVEDILKAALKNL